MNRNRILWAGCSIAATLALSACSTVSDDESVSRNDAEPQVEVSSCGTVNDPWADSLVLLATTKAQASFEQMGEALAGGDMEQLRSEAPSDAEAMIDQVLAKYPGHCNAQFAKATLTLTHIVNAKELDTLIQLMNVVSEEDDGIIDEEDGIIEVEDPESSLDFAQAMNQDVQGVPASLFKGSYALQNGDAVTITRIQDAVEKSVMPLLDSTQAFLQNAMNYDDFAFRFKRDGRVYEIDKGEIGPALAAVKVARAYVIYFLAHELEVAKDGDYAFVDTLDNIKTEDFKDLRPGQVAALDHTVSLLNVNSLFTTIKSSWASAYKNIPSLLESALDDLQDGMRYGIDESKQGMITQLNDIYVVGTSAEADVDPADLQTAIDELERVRKYLRGPVTISYNKGKSEITVNIPKFFAIVDGYQDLLPYHTINEYATWADVVARDTSWWNDEVDYIELYWRGPIMFTNAEGKPTFGDNVMGEIDSLVGNYGVTALAGRIVFPDPTFGGVFPGLTQVSVWETLESLETIEANTEVCEDAVINKYGEIEQYETCSKQLPKNPSDLDILDYYL